MTQALHRHISEDEALALAHGLKDSLRDPAWVGCEECERRVLVAAGDRERARLLLSKSPLPTATTRRAAPKKWAVFAAAIAIGLVGGWLWQRTSVDPAAPQYSHLASSLTDELRYPMRGEPFTFRDAGLTRDELSAIVAYRAGNDAEALELLEGRTQSLFSRTLLADLLVRARRFEDALEIAESINLSTLPQPARRFTRWTYARALFGAGRPEDALKALSKIEPGDGVPEARLRDAIGR